MCKAIPVHPLIDYSDLADYMKSYPDKVAKWLADRIADDDMHHLAEEFYEVACYPDSDGPDFEIWREV